MHSVFFLFLRDTVFLFAACPMGRLTLGHSQGLLVYYTEFLGVTTRCHGTAGDVVVQLRVVAR